MSSLGPLYDLKGFDAGLVRVVAFLGSSTADQIAASLTELGFSVNPRFLSSRLSFLVKSGVFENRDGVFSIRPSWFFETKAFVDQIRVQA